MRPLGTRRLTTGLHAIGWKLGLGKQRENPENVIRQLVRRGLETNEQPSAPFMRTALRASGLATRGSRAGCWRPQEAVHPQHSTSELQLLGVQVAL